MGIYFNPTNESFTQAKNSMIYVDKTELLGQLNLRLSTENKCIAVSHARRFGKSHAAGMIDAYYSLGCDSSNLFENTKIADNPDYKKYMNNYNVIHLGYLGYDSDRKKAFIPNYEVATAFESALQTGVLSGYSDKILLVGINYDTDGPDKKHHTCVIEEWRNS